MRPLERPIVHSSVVILTLETTMGRFGNSLAQEASKRLLLISFQFNYQNAFYCEKVQGLSV